jgi:hypothetical protein
VMQTKTHVWKSVSRCSHLFSALHIFPYKFPRITYTYFLYSSFEVHDKPNLILHTQLTGNRGSIPGEGFFYSPQHSNRPWGLPSLIFNGRGWRFPRNNVARALTYALTSIKCLGQDWVEFHLHSPIRLHEVVLN